MNYEEDIYPGLDEVDVEDIAEVTGLSYSYSRKIRSGSAVPAKSHWNKLMKLISTE